MSETPHVILQWLVGLGFPLVAGNALALAVRYRARLPVVLTAAAILLATPFVLFYGPWRIGAWMLR